VIILQHTLVSAQGPPAGPQQIVSEIFRFHWEVLLGWSKSLWKLFDNFVWG